MRRGRGRRTRSGVGYGGGRLTVQIPVFLFAFGLEGISGGAEHPHISLPVADGEIFGIRFVQKAVHVGADGDFAGEEMAAERITGGSQVAGVVADSFQQLFLGGFGGEAFQARPKDELAGIKLLPGKACAGVGFAFRRDVGMAENVLAADTVSKNQLP